MKYLLTFECNRDGVLEVFCNREGLKVLMQRLQLVLDRGGHEHLMTASWAGNELTEVRFDADSVLVHQVNINVRPDDEKIE